MYLHKMNAGSKNFKPLKPLECYSYVRRQLNASMYIEIFTIIHVLFHRISFILIGVAQFGYRND